MDSANIMWVDNDILAIGFDHKPNITVREILPSDDKFIKMSKKYYPFMLTRALTVDIFDKVKEIHYHFDINKGFCYDGMSIPRFAWTLIGVSKEDNRGVIGSLIHDKLCIEKQLINYDRKLSSEIFKYLLIAGGMPKWKSNIMAFFVDNWQKTQKGWGK